MTESSGNKRDTQTACETDRRRLARLCQEATDAFDLELGGRCIYTEAATGPYSVTAPLAAMAGAEPVYAVAEDSSHGRREDAIEQTKELASRLGCLDNIVFIDECPRKCVEQADIVTNTGFVRPIDGPTVERMKPTAVVPLMYETWEFRDEDVDIEACWKAGIPVAGTDESDSRVRTKEYLAPLVQKLALENRIELVGCSAVVVGGRTLAKYAVHGLESAGTEVQTVAKTIHDDELAEYRIAESLADSAARKALTEADLLVVVEHWENDQLIGPEGALTGAELASLNDTIRVLHVCGAVDGDSLAAAEIPCTPEEPAEFGHMSFTVGYVGPKPVVDLHAGGLRVGQLLAAAREQRSSIRAVLDEVRAESVVDTFSKKFIADRGLGDLNGK